MCCLLLSLGLFETKILLPSSLAEGVSLNTLVIAMISEGMGKQKHAKHHKNSQR